MSCATTESLSPDQREIMMGKFRKLLKAHGKVIVDVHSFNYFNEKEEFGTHELNQLYPFWSLEDYYSLLTVSNINPEKVTLNKYTIIEASGRKELFITGYSTFSVDSLKGEFERKGLK